MSVVPTANAIDFPDPDGPVVTNVADCTAPPPEDAPVHWSRYALMLGCILLAVANLSYFRERILLPQVSPTSAKSSLESESQHAPIQFEVAAGSNQEVECPAFTLSMRPSREEYTKYDLNSQHFNEWNKVLSVPDAMRDELDGLEYDSQSDWYRSHTKVVSRVFDEYSLWDETIRVEEGGKSSDVSATAVSSSSSSSNGADSNSPQRLKEKLEKKETIETRAKVLGVESSVEGGFPQKVHLKPKLPDYSKCSSPEAASGKQTLNRIHASPVFDLNEECADWYGNHKRLGRVAGGFSVTPPVPVSSLSIPHPCGSSQAVLAGIQHGKWIGRYEWFHGGPFYQAQNANATDEEEKEAWYTGCPMLNYTPEQVCKILSRFSRVIYIGDSLNRHMFSATLMMITGNQQYGHLKRDAFATYDKWRITCVGANAMEEQACRHLATYTVGDMAFPSCPHFDDTVGTSDMNEYADFPSQRLAYRQWPRLGYIHEEGWESVRNSPFHYSKPEDLIREKVAKALKGANTRHSSNGGAQIPKKNANIIPFRTEPLGALMLVNAGLHMVADHMQDAQEYYNELFRVFELVPHIPLFPVWLPIHRMQDARMLGRVPDEFLKPQMEDNCNFRANRKIARILRAHNSARRKQLATASKTNLSEEDLGPFVEINKSRRRSAPLPTMASNQTVTGASSVNSPHSPKSASSSPSILMCPNLQLRPSTPWLREWTALNFRSMTACTPPQWSWDGLHYIPSLNIAKVTSLLNYMHALIQEHDRNFEEMERKEFEKQRKQRKHLMQSSKNSTLAKSEVQRPTGDARSKDT